MNVTFSRFLFDFFIFRWLLMLFWWPLHISQLWQLLFLIPLYFHFSWFQILHYSWPIHVYNILALIFPQVFQVVNLTESILLWIWYLSGMNHVAICSSMHSPPVSPDGNKNTFFPKILFFNRYAFPIYIWGMVSQDYLLVVLFLTRWFNLPCFFSIFGICVIVLCCLAGSLALIEALAFAKMLVTITIYIYGFLAAFPLDSTWYKQLTFDKAHCNDPTKHLTRFNLPACSISCRKLLNSIKIIISLEKCVDHFLFLSFCFLRSVSHKMLKYRKILLKLKVR